MASIQEPEVQLAQKLASNEKLVRTKAVKKLRKYINGRSQIATGGFSGDELLKLWKGLFYCLWMQDKPLLQEELSNQISALMHSFHDVDGQLLYLESFLLTFKREWTGIDRLRMDKFFQLVRFMIKQTFEMLKRRNWESSAVAKFLKLLTKHLLQSSSGAPIGLQLHVLDLYMSELAAVGSAELTADQNLIFIEPFCKTAAKTKDRCLFSAICNSLLSTIIDQAPFAIEDLMKELKAAEDSDADSGQASEDDDNKLNENLSKPVGRKRPRKQINGNASNDSDSDDAGLLQGKDSDTEVSCNNYIGHVLQFNYGALADRLFELASRRSTLSRNRQRLYKIVKVLRDLNEGIFPQDEYPEEVSTDEDDDMFGSRKRMKRVAGHTEGKDGGVPEAKKGGQKASTPDKRSKNSVKDDNKPADLTANKKKRKKKAMQDGGAEQMHTVARSTITETEGSLPCSQRKKAQTQSSLNSVTVAEGQSEAVLLSEGPTRPTVSAIEKNGQPGDCNNRPCQTAEPAEAQQAPLGTKPDMSSEPHAVSGKKKGLKAMLHMDEVGAKLHINTEAEIIQCVESAEKNIATKPETDCTTPAKRKRRPTAKNLKEAEVNAVGTSICCQVSKEDDSNIGLKTQTDSLTPCNDSKGSNPLPEAQLEEEEKPTNAGVGSVVEEASQDTTTAPLPKKKKTKSKQEDASHDPSTVLRLNKKKKPQMSRKTGEGHAAAEKSPCDITVTAPANNKRKELPVVCSEVAKPTLAATEVVCPSGKPQKKRKIPVVFEYEVDELEAALINGVADDDSVTKKSEPDCGIGESSTPIRTKKSQKTSSDFCTFQSNITVPMPLFFKTKGSASKKNQTPKSESKKVTFGLKNNKTAETKVWGLEVSSHTALWQKGSEGQQEDQHEYSKEYAETTALCSRLLLTDVVVS
ncbi:ribosomal RNA processing protein 1 homolog B isoform X2 [Pungitius pungitius]|uniref:ribosomal RNA processing protein 1 homolog B isoform X2 n=1 Tax=Pungitius pungitius TaxID=134920 RepID=UPI002E0FB170